jgi:ribosome-binding ATPase YchF (GTP1/OBG family)
VAYKLLKQQTYFTAGVKEVRAWTINIGSTAPQAAGGFILISKRIHPCGGNSYEDYVAYGSEAKLRKPVSLK